MAPKRFSNPDFFGYLERLRQEVLRFALLDLKTLSPDDPLFQDAAVYVAESFALGVGYIPEFVRRHLDLSAYEDSLESILGYLFGGRDWRNEDDFRNVSCLRCGKASATWRPVLRSPHPQHPASWRYSRPENHLPMCLQCYRTSREKHTDIAEYFWGDRFRALMRWHLVFAQNPDVTWKDLQDYPLWPPEFGGPDWESGCPAITMAAARIAESFFMSQNRKSEIVCRIIDTKIRHRGRARLVRA